ncbi:ABC1 kinase family protein [Crocosphaera watsonii]|uniref:Ubiquinone biosynthesis monooxygenase UbiB n=2 Tax=Crocosphaera watsonii TaxID=263511 RepID=G5JD02_CROWT|nr:AarF/ABC1/UbiB kinase family protein [Crocosphaera watsonii]EHJ09929.1 Ubiquinone biosynthesis monooxygenase UbiB [Crocosphaera watsonii WH 0003]CCQ54778.1 Ubiquinone biosynthesis monooxygenase UbiB [Crocosphaera watsonii WH 0005]
MFSLTQTSARQREIIEVVLSNGWDYMKGLLTGKKDEDPNIPTPEVLRNILVELGPFYVKLGQILSTRPDILPPNYIKALTALQANVPPVSWEAIERLLSQELGQPIESVFSKINQQPIAAGSIGQIHRATLTTGEEVAIKFQRPGIDKIVEQDISLIKGVAELVSLTDFGENYDIVELADEFSQAIKAELDFTKEANYTDKIRNNLSESRWFDTEQLVIPKVYWEVTSEKILVLEWLHGKPILEADLSIPESTKSIEIRKQEITTLLFRAFFQQLYLDGFFHADPHPGNIFYLDNGKIAIIDCGMVGKLDPRTQQILTELLLAIFDLDAQGCTQLTIELSQGGKAESLERLRNDYEQILRKYYDLSLSQFNFSEVVYEILQIARKNKLKVPGNLGLYAKCLANLEGAARQFNPQINLFDEIKPLMTDLFRRQLIGDTPLQTSLRTVLDLKSIYLKTPRQVDILLDRLSSETLQWNLRLKELEPLRRSVDSSANRLSFSIVLGSLIMGAAIISTGSSTQQLSLISTVLFAAASLLGVWLIISILRSGRLK